MINLIKNEITKILKKKSIYVMIIVTFAFIILTNVLYKFVIPKFMNEFMFDDIINESIKEEMKNLNLDDLEQAKMYVADKTTLDTNELAKKYDNNSWQYAVIQEMASDLIYQVNNYTYVEKNSELLENAKKEYDKFIDLINKGDWKEFVNSQIQDLNEEKNLAISEEQKEMVNSKLQILQMRLDYNIEYGSNFKNDALMRYTQGTDQLKELEKNNNKTYKEKKEYQDLKEEVEKCKYAIEKNVDIINMDNTRGILLNLFSEYGIFVTITVVLIAGTIVSEEFNKGTIKLLLVRPHSRNKILLSKFIAVLLTIVFVMIVIIVMQLVVGTLFYGISSLKIPQVVYNHKLGRIQEINLIWAIIKEFLGILPLYILIGTLAFSISAILNNTAVAITVSLLGYMASNIINQITYSYNVKWIKYFVTPNWDLTVMFNGKLHEIEGINITFSSASLFRFAISILFHCSCVPA